MSFIYADFIALTSNFALYYYMQLLSICPSVSPSSTNSSRVYLKVFSLKEKISEVWLIMGNSLLFQRGKQRLNTWDNTIKQMNNIYTYKEKPPVWDRHEVSKRVNIQITQLLVIFTLNALLLQLVVQYGVSSFVICQNIHLIRDI